jgi:type III secretion protein C
LRVLALAAGLAVLPAAADAIAWKLPTYTLVARDMNLRTALDTFAVAEGLSIVMSDAVGGTFSGDFRDIPAGEFLNRIATYHNLTWYYDGAALYVYGAGEIQTMLIDLQYMKAGEVRAMLAELGVEDARFPIKTTSNDELIMVSGPPRYVELVAELIAKADKLREKRSFNEVEARIFPLVNTWADDVSFNVTSPESTLTIKGVARLLEELMNSSSDAKTHEAALTNNMEQLEVSQMAVFRPVIRPENRLNAVVVRDIASRMPMYERLIKQLDKPQQLVEIAVTTVEMSRKDALDWQLSLQYADAHGHSDGAVGQNPANLFLPASLAGKGLAGALTHIHSSYDLAVSLTALREKGKARNISRTTLLTVNNLAAEMSDSQSYHARVVGTEVATLESVTAGTKLQIKPRIIPALGTNMDNQVWLSMRLDDGGFEAVTVDAMPMTRASSLQTQTAVFEGESIMLAGYLRDIEEDAGWGIPYLRDIPWIGWLFGGKSTKNETVQRMFILTPHVVDLDTEMLARLQATRLRDVAEAEELEDDAEESDNARRRRDLERKYRRERRSEQEADTLERREAELKHGKAMRQVERERVRISLSEAIRLWEEEEKAEAAKLREEVKEAKRKDAEEAKQKDTE